jgi:hypothetical protein
MSIGRWVQKLTNGIDHTSGPERGRVERAIPARTPVLGFRRVYEKRFVRGAGFVVQERPRRKPKTAPAIGTFSVVLPLSGAEMVAQRCPSAPGILTTKDGSRVVFVPDHQHRFDVRVQRAEGIYGRSDRIRREELHRRQRRWVGNHMVGNLHQAHAGIYPASPAAIAGARAFVRREPSAFQV